MKDKPLGKVVHYYDKIGVAVLSLNKPLKVGDKIRFTGRNEFTQEVGSLQLDHKPVSSVKAKVQFGLKVEKPVHENNQVFLA